MHLPTTVNEMFTPRWWPRITLSVDVAVRRRKEASKLMIFTFFPIVE